jgi:glutaredoxin 3
MEYLSQRGIPFVEKNIRTDPSALRELIEAGYSSTPVIKVDGKAVVGFDRSELDAALAEA